MTTYQSINRINERIQRYCVSQERSVYEVDQKLKGFNVSKTERERIIEQLTNLKFIDEKRLVSAYIRGKSNGRQWGKNKIVFGLKSKRIPTHLIEEGLKQLEEDSYLETMRVLVKAKLKRTKEDNTYKLKAKVYAYLYNKGYESERILQVIGEVIST